MYLWGVGQRDELKHVGLVESFANGPKEFVESSNHRLLEVRGVNLPSSKVGFKRGVIGVRRWRALLANKQNKLRSNEEHDLLDKGKQGVLLNVALLAENLLDLLANRVRVVNQVDFRVRF
jgi:hypothetical protein